MSVDELGACIGGRFGFLTLAMTRYSRVDHSLKECLNATERFVCYRTDSPSYIVARSSRMVHDRVTLCQVFTMFKHRLESYQ
jgi:hypothetical protein